MSPVRRRGRPGLSDRAIRRVVSVGSAAIPFSLAAALVPLRSDLALATVAVALALVVAILSAAGTRASAVLAALSAGVGFDVFFTRPYGSLAITRAADIQLTLLLVAVGLVVGQMAVRNRLHRGRAEDASYDLSRIHGVAEMVAQGAPVDQVVTATANELQDLLGLRSCRFEPSFADRPGPFVERHGAITWGSLHWGYATMGLPADPITLVVEHQGRPLGRFVLVARAGVRVTSDQLLAAVALADQAGSALAASGAIDRS